MDGHELDLAESVVSSPEATSATGMKSLRDEPEPG
jgi:hypothetical protein